MVGRSCAGDGVSRIGCGEGMNGGSYCFPLLKVTELTFSLGFSSACEGSLPIFCVSWYFPSSSTRLETLAVIE